ncbi:GNAT family N-acetyltransferase [Rhodovulum euryhalinum]|uniref:Acetyltransferase (GNAT) family protein n=1 Tax=Rhodovulum euryhalinum TaxID=35805 RepID=A0A4R2KJN0_9RHOB|nr:GNAT family N-acetyltransferase [Rhodovulum euryhalinum]TCO70796.1 acetyltransferase (GNAT) family protein [Rhodovulum euryhalinum]
MKMRQMTRDELDRVLGWAADEGWNPGLEDAGPFHATDPAGFFVAEADGQVVAAISVVNHTDAVAFLGLYICHPDHRGRGIGHALWRHALDHAGTRTVGLDGVAAQQANYARSGFARAGCTTRHAGVLPGAFHAGIGPAAARDRPALIALEARATGYEKPRFLGAWLADTSTRKTLVARKDGEIAGLVTVRTCREGVKIGPLVARTEPVAAALIEAAGVLAGEARAMIDVPEGDRWLAAHCAALGLSPVFETARMYKGPAPVGGGVVSAVATLELG